MKRFYPILLLLTGCTVTPFIAAKHVDATPANGGNDAWDLAGGGVKIGDYLKIGAYKNLRGGELFEIGVEHDLWEK
jgi:hypothetical protein